MRVDLRLFGSSALAPTLTLQISLRYRHRESKYSDGSSKSFLTQLRWSKSSALKPVLIGCRPSAPYRALPCYSLSKD